MTTDPKTRSRFRRLARFLLWASGSFLLALILFATLLLFLPKIVSTQWFRGHFEQWASETLKNPISLDRLEWSWSRGIMLEGLKIADDPSFSADPLVSMDRGVLVLDPKQLLQRRAVLDLKVEGLRVHVVRNLNGQTNIGKMLSRLAPPTKPKPSPPPTDWKKIHLAIPVDLQGEVKLNKISVIMDDHLRGRSLVARNASLFLEIPSLMRKPIVLRMSSELIMDGTPLAPLQLSAQIEDLVDTDSSFNLKQASCKIEGGLPGLRLSAKGALSEMGLKGQLDLDLAPLLEIAQPFLPASTPKSSGTIRLGMEAVLDPRETVDFKVTVEGDNVIASGGALETNRVGPLNLSLSEKGSMDLKRGSLEISRGEIQIQEKSRLSFQGVLNGIIHGNLQMDMAIGPVFLDLKELFLLGKAFMPRGLSFDTQAKEGPFPELRLEELRLVGSIAEGTNHLQLGALSLLFPAIRLKNQERLISAEAINVQVKTADIRLKDRFPTQADILANLELQNLHIKGKRGVKLRRLAFPTLEVVAKDMTRSRESFFGLVGNLFLNETGEMEGLTVARDAQVPRVRHTFKTRCTLSLGRPVSIQEVQADISAPGFYVNLPPYGPIKSGLDLDIDLSELHLVDFHPLRLDLKRLRTRLDLKGLFKALIEASLTDSGRDSLETNGNAKLYLKGITPLLATRLPKDWKLDGGVELEWNFRGKLPGPTEEEAFSDPNLSIYERLKKIESFEHIYLKIGLKDVMAHLPLSGNGWFKASQVRTEAPLILNLEKGFEKSSLKGKVVLGRIEGLPSLGELRRPLRASISIECDQEGLRTIRFSQGMDLDPFGVNQSLTLSLDRIDRVLRREIRPLLSALLEKGEGSITTRLGLNAQGGLSWEDKGVSLKGSLKSEAHLALSGENEIRVGCGLESPGLDVSYGNKIRITNLRSHLELEKRFRVGYKAQGQPVKVPPTSLLSKNVFQTESKQLAFSKAQEAAERRLMDNLRGRLASRRAFSFSSARIDAGPLPLEISNAEVEFRLLKSLPMIDHFQFDLMGGSVVGRLSLRKRETRFELETDCSFSGLNPNLLIPGITARLSDQRPKAPDDADLSGALSLELPLVIDPADLLYHTRLTLRLTHIGSQTFERFLYALDPYESNEGIVKQREFLRMGTPVWIALQIGYGNLSLAGEVKVKGVRMELPRIERFNIAGLPIQKRLRQALSALGPILNALQTLSADDIILSEDGAIRFLSSGN